MDFRFWALLSAASAGVTAVLAKKGVEEVPTNLALTIRVFFILIIAGALALFTGQTEAAALSRRAWVFLFFSAIGTGASWLCYFQALKSGPVSQVAPIDKLSFVVAVALGFLFLKEPISPKVIGGSVLIVIGVLVTLS